MGLGWDGEPDMESRDPNAINEHLGAVAYEEVIGEPDGIHSIDCVWRFSYKCFNLWRNLCYIIMTTLCGIFIATCWGCEFATIAFSHIWCLSPCFKVIEMNALSVKRFIGVCVHCFCDPCCEAFGLMFSAFKK